MANEIFSQYSYLLDRTARRVKQYAQRKFNEENFDITVDQWLVIKNLSLHNDKNQSELAELIGKDHPTFTRIADLLCKKGFVERKPHATDRRSFILHLTEEGKQRVEDWSPKMASIRMRAWENLTQDDYEHLRRILNTIYNNLDL